MPVRSPYAIVAVAAFVFICSLLGSSWIVRGIVEVAVCVVCRRDRCGTRVTEDELAQPSPSSLGRRFSGFCPRRHFALPGSEELCDRDGNLSVPSLRHDIGYFALGVSMPSRDSVRQRVFRRSRRRRCRPSTFPRLVFGSVLVGSPSSASIPIV